MDALTDYIILVNKRPLWKITETQWEDINDLSLYLTILYNDFILTDEEIDGIIDNFELNINMIYGTSMKNINLSKLINYFIDNLQINIKSLFDDEEYEVINNIEKFKQKVKHKYKYTYGIRI